MDEEALIRRIREEFIDNFDEELEMEIHDFSEENESDNKMMGGASEFRRIYLRELHRLQVELVKLQDWVVESKEKIVVLFEGRDSAGKGSTISPPAGRWVT